MTENQTSDIRVTVVICTYNRADLLVGALRSVLEQSYPSDLYEVVVVDNASTDNTTDVVRLAIDSWPRNRIKLVHEPVAGIGHARNTGVSNASGELIAFTDDDAIVNPRWIENAIACIDQFDGALAGLAGQVVPRYAVKPPAWYPEDCEADFRGFEGRVLRPDEYPSGNNMFILREAILHAGGFPAMGMQEGTMAYGEETALFQTMRNQDASIKFYYAPEVVVEHIIPPYKTTVSYILKRALMNGVYEARDATDLSMARRSISVLLVAVRVGLRVLVAAIALLVNLGTVGRWLVKYCAPVLWEIGRLLGLVGYVPRLRQRPVS